MNASRDEASASQPQVSPPSSLGPPTSAPSAVARRAGSSAVAAILRWSVRSLGIVGTGFFVLYGISGLGAGHGTTTQWNVVFAPFALEHGGLLAGPLFWLVVFACAPSRLWYLRVFAATLLTLHYVALAQGLQSIFFAPNARDGPASFGPPPMPLAGADGLVYWSLQGMLCLAILWPRRLPLFRGHRRPA